MAFIRKNFIWFLFIVVVAFGGYTYLNRYVPCARPVSYSIGTFDDRFGISREKFLSEIQISAKKWEDVAGKKLFVLENRAGEKASLPISLIYDERQETYLRTKKLETQVTKTVESADTIKQEFNTLKERHITASSEYASLVETMKAKQSAYNTQVEFWNKKGGAPENEYNKLQAEKSSLAQLRAVVEAKRLEVNRLADEVNALISKYNYLVKDVNSTIQTINQHADKEFEEGEYISDQNGQRIHVYEFEDNISLSRVLTHELGHALGLVHNENPDSIMYYLNQSKNTNLTVDDVQALKARCNLK